MPYIPPSPGKSPPQPYRCAGCRRWWVSKPGMERVNCTIAHSPGSCCHEWEVEVAEPVRTRPFR